MEAIHSNLYNGHYLGLSQDLKTEKNNVFSLVTDAVNESTSVKKVNHYMTLEYL